MFVFISNYIITTAEQPAWNFGIQNRNNVSNEN